MNWAQFKGGKVGKYPDVAGCIQEIFESDFVNLLIAQILAVKPHHHCMCLDLMMPQGLKNK